MALVYHDRVAETVTTEGTVSFTLTGTTPTGYRPFSTLTAADTCYYHANNRVTNEWEVGLGTYSSGTLTRDTILSSSYFGNKIDFTEGTKDLSLCIPSLAISNMLTAIAGAVGGDSNLIWSHEVTGAATGEIVASDLDINAHGGYKVVIAAVSGATSDVSIQVNNDSVAANYTRRSIASSGTTASTDTSSTNLVCSLYAAGSITYAVIDMARVNGYAVWNSMSQQSNTTYAHVRFFKHNTTQTNITALNFVSSATSGFGIGSKFYIFRKANS
jgi:hypothetical protein